MEYYSVSQTAKQFKVTRATVHYWINRGLIKSTLVGTQYMLTDAEIERYKKERNGS